MLLAWLAVGLVGYTYVGYPVLLRLLARAPGATPPPFRRWPAITITVPVHNGAGTIGLALERILAARYPGERQILVISDGSTDATDLVVAAYASRGVELLVLPERVGKTEAENRAIGRLRGEIIINTDASVQLHHDALPPLVAALADPTVGVASAWDVSVEHTAGRNQGETTYVDGEMRLRDLETAAGGIVGASGCLYAIRAELHARPLPGHLSRDFAAALHAREAGYRAVSVPAARCDVPRARPGAPEYRRKVRTMARGLATLAYHRHLLDPFRYGRFAWMLWSHKLLRWLTPFALVLLALLLVLPGSGTPAGRLVVIGGSVGAALGWWWPERTPPRLLALLAYAGGAVVAGIEAWGRALTGSALAVWEPTRRGATTPPVGPA